MGERRRSRLGSLSALSVATIAAAAMAVSADAARSADPALARELQRGGLVLVLRHAATDFSKPDHDPVDLADCRTQRNLSAQGRADARAIARGVRRLKLRIGTVLTSAFCRTRETARLAFGGGTTSTALLNTINTEHNARWRAQIRAARRLVGTRPPPGRLAVLVTHGSVVGDTIGLTLDEGETLVCRPRATTRCELLGRIKPGEWKTLPATG
jgi:phosphohistidine phosphatase SixA